jgi:hypothetical protein
MRNGPVMPRHLGLNVGEQRIHRFGTAQQGLPFGSQLDAATRPFEQGGAE